MAEMTLDDSVECYRNSGGFEQDFPEGCIDKLHLMATALERIYPDGERPRPAADRPCIEDRRWMADLDCDPPVFSVLFNGGKWESPVEDFIWNERHPTFHSPGDAWLESQWQLYERLTTGMKKLKDSANAQ